MAINVLIVSSQQQSVQELVNYFSGRKDQTFLVSDSIQAETFLKKEKPDIVLIDIHLPGNHFQQSIKLVNNYVPHSGIIVTSQKPSFRREEQAREMGITVFLREPFTPEWIEKALDKLSGKELDEDEAAHLAPGISKVRFPVRIKITLPYVILALLFAMGAAYLASQLIFQSIQDRFNNQLIDSGKKSADWMVVEENRLLSTLRLVANTDGVAQDIQAGDADSLRQILLPLAVNSNEEAIEVLDTQGKSVFSLRHVAGGTAGDYTYTQGDTSMALWDFVQPVLQGKVDAGRDKYSGEVHAAWGDYFYVSGPVHSLDGTLVGVVLVGKTLTTLARQMDQANLVDVTFYDKNGKPIASTLYSNIADSSPVSTQMSASILTNGNSSTSVRELSIAGVKYSEILSPWTVRSNQNIGLLGITLPQAFLINSNQVTQTQIFFLVIGVILLVVLIGITISNQITRPLLRIVKASSEVANGNLEVKVDSKGNDEVAVLSHTFNYMVAELQEGSVYRDLLGRTVSPEVREQLRQTFTSGNLKLEGQEATATVLITDIRGFTTLSEDADPATVFQWLNEYFGEIVPIVTQHGGVVNKFDGDAMLAFFGILPRLLEPRQSAYAGCQAAVEILAAIDRLNQKRVERGNPPFLTGIGVNTGALTAGGLGTSDRVHYTIIGDTVNTTQRLEALTRQLINGSGVIISQATFDFLGEHSREFETEYLGSQEVKGKSDEIGVYRMAQKVTSA